MKFLRKSLLIFCFLISACKTNFSVSAEKSGKYTVVRNVYYRFVRENFCYEIYLPTLTENERKPDYTISLFDHVYNFGGVKFYDDKGNIIYNEFIIDKRYLIIYDE